MFYIKVVPLASSFPHSWAPEVCGKVCRCLERQCFDEGSWKVNSGVMWCGLLLRGLVVYFPRKVDLRESPVNCWAELPIHVAILVRGAVLRERVPVHDSRILWGLYDKRHRFSIIHVLTLKRITITRSLDNKS